MWERTCFCFQAIKCNFHDWIEKLLVFHSKFRMKRPDLCYKLLHFRNPDSHFKLVPDLCSALFTQDTEHLANWQTQTLEHIAVFPLYTSLKEAPKDLQANLHSNLSTSTSCVNGVCARRNQHTRAIDWYSLPLDSTSATCASQQTLGKHSSGNKRRVLTGLVSCSIKAGEFLKVAHTWQFISSFKTPTRKKHKDAFCGYHFGYFAIFSSSFLQMVNDHRFITFPFWWISGENNSEDFKVKKKLWLQVDFSSVGIYFGTFGSKAWIYVQELPFCVDYLLQDLPYWTADKDSVCLASLMWHSWDPLTHRERQLSDALGLRTQNHETEACKGVPSLATVRKPKIRRIRSWSAGRQRGYGERNFQKGHWRRTQWHRHTKESQRKSSGLSRWPGIQSPGWDQGPG